MTVQLLSAAQYILGRQLGIIGSTPGLTYVITDIAANIATIPAMDFDASALGVTGIVVTDHNALFLTVDQALTIANSGLTLTQPSGNGVIVADQAANFNSLTAANIALLGTIGVFEFVPTDSRILFDLDQEDALTTASIFFGLFPNVTLSVAQYRADAAGPGGFVGEAGDTYGIVDSAANIETLTPAELTALSPLVLSITATDTSVVLDVAQVQALEAASIKVLVPAGDHVTVADFAANLATLSADQVLAEAAIGVSATVTLAIPNVALTVAQYRADAAGPGGLVGEANHTYSIADTAAHIETLAPDELTALSPLVLSITATDTSVVLDVAQAKALETPSIQVLAPDGDNVTVADTATDLRSLSANQLLALPAIGVSAVTVTDVSLDLKLSQIQALITANVGINPATGDTVIVADQADNLATLTPGDIANLGNAGVTEITSTDSRIPLSLAQEDALGGASIVVTAPPANVTLTVAQYLADVASSSGFVPQSGDRYAISDSAANIQALTPAEIAAIPSWVTEITATDTSVVISAAQALALEAASIEVTVPSRGTVTVVDSAATLQALSTNQLQALLVTGVKAVAASDTVPVFTAAQMHALGSALVAVAAPPGNAAQNDGTAEVSGPSLNGMAFYITWDSSVASAPAAFKADVEETFQFYADEFNGPALYYNVGFGEVAGEALGAPALGESVAGPLLTPTYAQLLTAMTENQLSSAEIAAVASLPLTSPEGGAVLSMTPAEAQALGIVGGDATSAQSPDGSVGFSDTAAFDYASDPDQVAATDNAYDFFGTVEHEESEIMGRVSYLNDAGSGGATTSYSLMDLFRYADAGSRQLSSVGNPSYFSIDNGVTNLDPTVAGHSVGWNNFLTGNSGDLGDWGQLAAPIPYSNDSYNDNSSSNVLDPVSASDITLMNVLGYDLAVPTETVPLPPVINYLFFDGTDANGNNALWVSDGTAAFTRELTGVDGIAGNLVEAQDITAIGTVVVFNGTDLHGDDGLWVSNGLVLDTKELTGIANAASAAQGGLNPTNLTTAGNEVWFDGTDASGTVGLWQTDGTAANTREVAAGITASNITADGDGIAFIGADGGIWQSNGTSGGTEEITPAPGTSLGVFTVPDPLISPTATVSLTMTVPATGLQAFDLFKTSNGSVIYGGSYEYTLPGQETPIISQGLLNLATGLISQTAPGPGGFANVGTMTYYEGMITGLSVIVGQVVQGTYGEVWQTDGSIPGTEQTGDEGYDPTNLTSFDGLLLYSSQPDLGINSIPGDYPLLGNFVGAMGTDLTVAPFPSQDAVIETSGGMTIGYSGDALDLSSPGYYLAFPAGAVAGGGPQFDSDLFPDALTNQHAQGLDPTGITEFDGNAYFNGINAAGQHELWELGTDALELLDGGVASTHIVNGGEVQAPILDGSGAEFTGINGASTAGLDPSNITALVINRPFDKAITLGQLAVDLEMDQIDPGSNNPPTGLVYDVTDTALDLESMTPAEITGGEAIGVEGLASTDASVRLDAAMAQAMSDQVVVTVPMGDKVSVADLAANIEKMTEHQLSDLTEIGVTALKATDTSVVLTVAQALGLENPVLVSSSTVDIAVTVPAGDTATIADKAAAIEALSPGQIMALPSIGVTAIAATDGSITLTVAQALAYEGGVTLSVPAGDSIIIVDTVFSIESLTPAEILALPGIGVVAVMGTGGSILLQPLQAEAFLSSGLALTVSPGGSIITNFTDNLTAAAIEALTPVQIAVIVANGYTTIAALDMSVQLSAAVALSIADAPLRLTVPASDIVTVEDNNSDIQLLTPAQITALGVLGVSALLSTGGQIFFSVQQVLALEAASISLKPAPLKVLQWQIEDTSAQIETLSPSQILALPDIHPGAGFAQIMDSDSPLTLSVAQFSALEIGAVSLSLNPFATVTVTGTATQFEALSASALATLPFFGSPITISLTVTSGSLVLSVAQLQALQSSNLLSGLTLPAGATITVADTAAALVTFLASGTYPSVTEGIPLSSIMATNDTPVALSVQEAEALEAGETASEQPIPISAPVGDTVTLVDTAADIEGMSAQQLGELTAYGITAITVTDQSITLTVAQALALFDPVPISVPPGASVIIADTEAEIDSLTPAEIVGLASIGVTTIDVSNLTGAEPLTIDAGITLTIAGAVPSNETITFAGSGGVLALGDTLDMAGTIDGFSPPDTIDLTDIPFDNSGSASLQSGNTLQVVENGATYGLQLDPTQVFLTATNFVLNPDTGNGSLLTVTEAQVTSYFAVSSGQTVDGVVVGNGGEVEVNFGAVSNRSTVTSGGELLGDDGATINESVIDSGGSLELGTGFSGTGTIGFGPVAAGPAGGTLRIDDQTLPSATIAGFAPGDLILLPGVTGFSDSLDGSGETLTIFSNGLSIGALDFSAPVTVDELAQVRCFAEGTRIETPAGSVAVETLAVGDAVTLASGASGRIVWVGSRAVDCGRHPRPETVWPVRVSAGAFGDNVPVRDLYLSPDHAVFVREVLVPVKHLINGTSITQMKRRRVTYHHVELVKHAVILAEGLAVESYLDTGDRADFGNEGTIRLFPDFAAPLAPNTALLWETKGAAALVITGAELAAARAVVAVNAPRHLSVQR